jgi:cytochrome c-type biogenesis protein CcmH
VTRLAALFLLLISFAVSANEAQPTEQDPVAAARAVTLANELRCLVCQNQSIAESNAELAVDLRHQIKEQIAAGKSDGEIVNFMVQRYGDFVLYRPPLRGTTLLLWSGPALLLVVGLAVLVFSVRKRQRQIVDQPLSDEEHRQAERLLAGGSEKKPT